MNSPPGQETPLATPNPGSPGPQGQYPGPQYPQQYQQPGQTCAPAGWEGSAYQAWPNQPQPSGDPDVAVSTGKTGYCAAQAEYYRSLGTSREADIIEQQACGGQTPVAAGRKKCKPPVSGAASKRPSEDSGEEPPRERRRVRRAAREEDVSETDESGTGSSHRAARPGGAERGLPLLEREAYMRLLEIEGAKRLREFWSGKSLDLALKAGNEAAAELLVASDPGIDVRDEDGRTVLHWAAEKGFLGVVTTLLRRGAHPHVKDRAGDYPILLSLERRARNEDIPKMILSWCALRGISVDWGEMELGEDDLRFGVEELARCDAEVRLMGRTRVPASSLSYLDLVTRHVSRVTSRLPAEGVGGASRHYIARRDFPVYADRIASRLRDAGQRRVRADRCLEAFSHLSPRLPSTFTAVVLLCLGDSDMENFHCAFPLLTVRSPRSCVVS